MLRFGVLGQVTATDERGELRLAQGRQRLLLAVLVAHAGETVSIDRLIDALWGASPPPTAGGGLQNLVSASRKVLGDERIVTEGRGYRLVLGHDDEIDAQRFEVLSTTGRAALAEGNADHAAETLRAALALWRGPAFGDLAYEPALSDQAGGLEERRLAVLEERIDADLALGRHRDLVGELEMLIAREPLRERLRGQQMLALYRAGRQADALRSYADARKRLVTELGLEPGPALRELEHDILAHAPALILSPPTTEPRRATGSQAPGRRLAVSRRPSLVAAAGAALLLGALGAGLALGGGEGDDNPRQAAGPARSGDLLVAIDPATNRVVQRITVGRLPTSVTVGAGAAWTFNSDDGTVSRYDLREKAVRTFAAQPTVVEVDSGADGLWVAEADRPAPGSAESIMGNEPVSLERVEPVTGATVGTTDLSRPPRWTMGVPPGQALAVGSGAAWVLNGPGWVHRLDERTTAERVDHMARARAIAAGSGQVWIYDSRGRVVELAPETGRRRLAVPLPAASIDALAVGRDAVWGTDSSTGLVWRVDPRKRTARTIDVGAGVGRIAVAGDAVWVTNSVQGTISRIDPVRNRVAATIHVEGTPRDIAVGAGRVWVGVAGVARPLPAAGELRAGAKVVPLPAPPCGGVITAASGRPDLLIASDLPLSRQSPSTKPMSQAVAFVLRRHRFRAGRFTLGLQSCNDAGAETGVYDEAICRRNASAYVRATSVIGVVGPLNSGCAGEMLPILSRAGVQQPLLVSPSNSAPRLVRADPALPDDDPKPLYPTGQRGYARPYPSDDVEYAADAMLAQKLAAGGGVFFVEDEFAAQDVIGRLWFDRAAGRLGLDVVGHAVWKVDDPRFAALARRIRDAHPRVVYLLGSVPTGVGDLLKALRATLPSDVAILGGQPLLPVSVLFAAAGDAARGVLITSPGLTEQSLGAAARRSAREFAATQPGQHVTTLDLYAAAATEVLLDAIARSDGTRASAVRALRVSRLADSTVGPVALDVRGEPTSQPITVVRAQRAGGRQDEVLGLEGSDVVEVLRPPARLVGASG